MKKNTPGQVIDALMLNVTDGSAFIVGVSVFVKKGIGAFNAGTGMLSHISGGVWEYQPEQAETNDDHCSFLFIGTNAISSLIQAYTMFPQTGDLFSSDFNNTQKASLNAATPAASNIGVRNIN